MTPIEQDQHFRVTHHAWLDNEKGEPIATSEPVLRSNATHAVYGWSTRNLIILATGDQTQMETFAAAENTRLANSKPYVANRYQASTGDTLENWSTPGEPEVPPQVQVKPICWTKAAPICHLRFQNTTLIDWLTIQDAQIFRYLVALGLYEIDITKAKELAATFPTSSANNIKLPAEQIEIWQTWSGNTPHGRYRSPAERHNTVWSLQEFLQYCKDNLDSMLKGSLYKEAIEANQ